MFYHLVRWLSRIPFALYFRLARTDVDRVPGEGAALLAANHVSFLDPAMVGSTSPRKVYFLMTADIFRRSGLRWFFRWMDAIPVDRAGRPTRDAIRAALRRLAAGDLVGIFPEGARVDGAQLGEGLAGVALLARRSGAPVVPVGITGTDRAMPRGTAIPRPASVRVRYGTPFRHAEVTAGLAGREADEAFVRRLMESIDALRGAGSVGANA